MGKRQTFYARADLFEAQVSARAKLVLAYLSRVSDKAGVSFPSVATVAERCGCCPNSARKALRELEAAGYIAIEKCTLPTKSGKVRPTSSRYTLLFVPAKDGTAAEAVRSAAGQEALFVGAEHAVPPVQPMQYPTAPDAGLSYNKDFIIDVPYGHSQSVEETDPDSDSDRREKGLSAILSRLNLDLYRDKTFAKSVRHALRRMYHGESITVSGRTIPREDVRSVLDMLDMEHIDFVERQLSRATREVTCGERFLISCLYNAPLDCMAKDRCG